MSDVFNSEVVEPENFNPKELVSYDLIGFGSGIYNQKHHQRIFDFIDKLPIQDNKKAFVFSTNTFGFKKLNEPLKSELIKKGLSVIGEFSCPGFIDYSFIKYIFGGISKGRPNNDDLDKARDFSKNILKQF